jgi:hypothetical protein
MIVLLVMNFKDDSFSKENRMRNFGFLLFQDRLVSICSLWSQVLHPYFYCLKIGAN